MEVFIIRYSCEQTIYIELNQIVGVIEMKTTLLKLQVVILVVTIIFSIIGFCLLPDTVAVQWNSEGVSNYLPRYAASLIPIGVSVLCLMAWKNSAVRFSIRMEMSRTFRVLHTLFWIAFSCIGILLNIVFLLNN